MLVFLTSESIFAKMNVLLAVDIPNLLRSRSNRSPMLFLLASSLMDSIKNWTSWCEVNASIVSIARLLFTDDDSSSMRSISDDDEDRLLERRILEITSELSAALNVQFK